MRNQTHQSKHNNLRELDPAIYNLYCSVVVEAVRTVLRDRKQNSVAAAAAWLGNEGGLLMAALDLPVDPTYVRTWATNMLAARQAAQAVSTRALKEARQWQQQ